MRRMLTRRDFLKVAGAGVAGTAVLGAAACGSARQGGEGVTLRYMSMWNEEEPQQKVLQEMIDAFEDANPDVTVDVLWGGREVLTKVRSAIASGDAPDLVDKDAEELVGALVYTDQSMPLNDMASRQIPGEDTTIGEVIPEQYLSLLAYEGDQYLIPYEVITSGIWYNANLFEQWGVSPAETWDDLFALNETIRNQTDGVAPFTIDGNISIYNAYYFYWLAERYAGPGVFREAAGDETGEAWNNEQLLKAAEEVERFVNSDALSDGYPGNKYPAAQDAWAQGKAAMYLNGTWLPSETQPYADEISYAMFDFPSVPDGHSSAELYLIGWVVPQAANNPEVAKDFMAFALNRDRLKGIAEVAKNLTPRPDIEAPPDLADAKEEIEGSDSYHRIYDGIQAFYPGWWEQVFLPLDDDLFFGELTGQEFISRLQSRSVQYWERNA